MLATPATKEQDEAVKLYLASKSAWWHWTPNAWLATDNTGVLTAVTIRDGLKEVLPSVYTLVLEFSDTGDTWAGFGPNMPQKNMFDWVRRNWEKSK